jgi:peptide deformylase
MNLPEYVDINNISQSDELKKVLREPATAFTFPLTKEDLDILAIMEAKFDSETNCAGLAGPQLGFNKQIIVFSVTADEELKKWRPDLTQTMEKTIWINPSYKGIGDEKSVDYEACFSVADLAAPIERFKNISYQAYLPTGEKIAGEASGFLARVIQHETDHVNGILFIDIASKDAIFSISEYKKKKMEAIKADSEMQEQQENLIHSSPIETEL